MRFFIFSIALVSLVLCTSCGKKQKPANPPETGGNPIEQYGGVMSKTLQKAKGMDVVLPMKQLIDSFYIQEGRYPSTLQELVERNFIREIPVPPKGYRYSYDSSSGKIGLEPEN
ncbi:MAG: hypothetical protein NC830_00095 [Candidatus Omnitrophica bacterium]|nr:hypothetical protein [Candidatus Omnitrophota bacterium]